MIGQLFDTDVGADLVRRAQIRFSDVTAISVPLLDLRDALDRAACPALAPVVDGTLEPLEAEEKAFFVIGELLIGKREARLQFATHADLELKTDRIARRLGSPGLHVRGANDGSVVLESDIPEPIAMKPVTIPKVVKLFSFNNVRGYVETSNIKWLPLECREAAECEHAFGPFADRARGTIPALPPDEIELA